jgi:hypothetical protein
MASVRRFGHIAANALCTADCIVKEWLSFHIRLPRTTRGRRCQSPPDCAEEGRVALLDNESAKASNKGAADHATENGKGNALHCGDGIEQNEPFAIELIVFSPPPLMLDGSLLCERERQKADVN